MTRDQVKEVLDRVLTWPQKRQEDAVEILKAIEEQDASDLCLTDEQLAELRRRRAKKIRTGFRSSRFLSASTRVIDEDHV